MQTQLNKMMKTQLPRLLNSAVIGPSTSSTSPPNSSSNQSISPENNDLINYFQLPDEVLKRIAIDVPPKDRLKLELTCRRFRNLFSKWPDIQAIEIRSDVYDCIESPSTAAVSIFNFNSKPPRISFYIKLVDSQGRSHQLRNLQDRISIQMLKALLAKLTNLTQLTIWDSCLGPEFASTIAKMTTIKQLRLWNCSKYFEKKLRNKKLLHSLLGLSSLDELLILDSTPNSSNSVSCLAYFDKVCAQKLRAPIKNLQLTGLHLPLSSFQIIAERLAPSCTRLAIGCVFGKEEKRLDYLKTLMSMKLVNDLDFPPFLFRLDDFPVPDGVVEKILDDLPLKSLGFRHYNSSVLFRFIEQRLPRKIRVLRIHHNANRIPNFASLGEPEEPVVKKSSVYSNYSILSASRSSIGSSSAVNEARIISNGATQTYSSSSDSELLSNLAGRRLTIFALAEETKNSRNHKLKQKCYFGVNVFYLHQTRATLEVFGRMAAPITSPHIYSRNIKKGSSVRLIKGDLVKTIPLSSLGLESDYELSDIEDP